MFRRQEFRVTSHWITFQFFPAQNSNTLREHLHCATLTEQQKHSLAFLTCFLVMPLCACRSLLFIESRHISANCTAAASSACDPLRLSQRPSMAFVSSGPLCAVLHCMKCVLSLDLGISTAQKLLYCCNSYIKTLKNLFEVGVSVSSNWNWSFSLLLICEPDRRCRHAPDCLQCSFSIVVLLFKQI